MILPVAGERERERGLDWIGLDGLLYMSSIALYRMKQKSKQKQRKTIKKNKKREKKKEKRKEERDRERETDKQTEGQRQRKQLEISSPSHIREARKAIFRPILGAKGRVTFHRETEEPVVSKDRIAFSSSSFFLFFPRVSVVSFEELAGCLKNNAFCPYKLLRIIQCNQSTVGARNCCS